MLLPHDAIRDCATISGQKQVLERHFAHVAER